MPSQNMMKETRNLKSVSASLLSLDGHEQNITHPPERFWLQTTEATLI
jgi:hypothetical protein